MKVKLEEKYRQFYTLDDLDRAKAVIAYMKEDESTPADYAAYAAEHIASRRHKDNLDRIMEASAHTARNCRAWNNYGDDTQDMDVWIEFIAKTYGGFIIGGAYLTDIWAICSDDDLTGHMYETYYKKA